MTPDHHIPIKANRVLNVILVGLLLILIRVWYLSVVQRDEHLQKARKPQRRTVVEHIERATIRDRFNIPLALNKIQYNAAVCYAQIRQIPSISWKKNEQGKLIRVQERIEYIKNLSNMLARELDMNPVDIEDTIHAKASLFPHTPFKLKEDISEEQYFRLRMLEKEWLGVQMQKTSKRYYPQGKTASDIIGYMGAINHREYLDIAKEMSELEAYVAKRENGETPHLPKGFDTPMQVRARLKALQEKSYTINDMIGKAGIEGIFDEALRGYYGKKNYEVDMKGNLLRELPGSKNSVAGRRVLLSISSELQEFAESLLAQNEATRCKESGPEDLPWIKGGAIVAMDPNTGEIVTLASYPRFNPNDFVPSKQQRQSAVLRWLEAESYIGEIWDGKRPLERELFSLTTGTFYEDSCPLNWNRYLDFILPVNSSIRVAIDKLGSVRKAVHFQKILSDLMELCGQNEMRALIQILYSGNSHIPFQAALKQKEIDGYLGDISNNEDKMLVIDLCRMMAKLEAFSEPLLDYMGKLTFSSILSLAQAKAQLQSAVRTEIQELFHDNDFTAWRKSHFKTFLKQKRKEEKENKTYTRPYTEYLDLLEKKMFREFWDAHRFVFLQTAALGSFPANHLPEEQPYFAHLISRHKQILKENPSSTLLKESLSKLPENLHIPFLEALRSFDELSEPLFGKYRHVRNLKANQLEKHLASAFYPMAGFGYGRSQGYRQSSSQGSVFKLVTGYTALEERIHTYPRAKIDTELLNPLTLTDDLKRDPKNSNAQVLGYSNDGHAISRLYKGGRLPRSSHGNIGKVDILGALEQSSNLYFAILAGDHIQDPLSLARTARLFGFGQKTGIELPGEIPGFVPDDISNNRTGLYSFAIGQHSLVVTPLQTAVMVSALANHGKVLKPRVVQAVAGKEPSLKDAELFSTPEYPFREDLALAGIFFPIFTESLADSEKPYVSYSEPEVKRTLFLPPQVRDLLLEGMHRVICGPRGTARPHIITSLYENPQAMRDYLDLKNEFIGKTGTAQLLYKRTIDAASEAKMSTHVWFAGISFSSQENHFLKEPWSDPELVVIVYLRFGDKGGKEAAPLAAQIVKKWREISAKHAQ